MKRLAGAVALLGALSACSSEPPLTPEQQFLKHIHVGLDEKIAGRFVIYDDKMLSAGRLACSLIPEPGVTHSRIVAAGAKGFEANNFPDPFGAAEIVVTSAERDLCPTVHYAVANQGAT